MLALCPWLCSLLLLCTHVHGYVPMYGHMGYVVFIIIVMGYVKMVLKARTI